MIRFLRYVCFFWSLLLTERADAQFVNNPPPASNAQTLITYAGGFKANAGFLSSNFSDTTALNAGSFSFLKNIPGFRVNAGGRSYMRNATGNAWDLFTNQNDLSAAVAGLQPINSNLTTLAGLTPTTGNFLTSVGGAWDSRTPAQVRTTLSLVPGVDVLAPNGSAAALTSFPTFNQNTTGSAAKWTTARTIGITGDLTYNSGSFDGSANVTAAATVTGINGTSLGGLATGILKNTTATGVPSIAVAGDFPTLNQNTTGSAAKWTTARTIGITGDLTYNSGSFDGSANVTAAATVTRINGTSLAALGTGILKNTTATGVPSIAVAGDFPTLNQNTTGSAAKWTTARTIGITGDLTYNSGSLDGSANVTAAATVTGINGTSLATLNTGILKNTTATGVPSIAVAGDFPTLNQNTTGSAAKWTTARTIGITGDLTYNSGSLDGSANVTAAATVTGINGTSLGGLATGILKNTTTTGVPSIAVAGDFPTLNQNTTGSAAKWTTARTIGITGDLTYNSGSLDGSANVTAAATVTGINGTSLGGLATGILKNTTTTGVPSIAVAGDFPTLNQNTTGSAAKWTTARTIGITGDLTYNSGSLDGSANVTAAATVTGINGTSLGGLATGILKNTTTTGVPSIAVAGDFPTLNQNTTGSAAKWTTARSLWGNSVDGSADITSVIASTFGGTGNGFAKFSGPAATEKTFTLPNASATILTDNALVTSQQGGTGVNNGGRTITISTNNATFGFTNASKIVTFDNSLRFIGTDATSMTFPGTSASIARNDAAQTFVGQNTFPGILNSGEGSLTSATGAIANSETKILSSDAAMVASRLVAGTVIQVTLHGTCTSTAAGVGIIRVRYGTAASTADGIMQAFTLAAAQTSGTAIPFTIRMIITVRTTGAAATSDGGLDLINSGTTGLSTTATQVVRGSATTINTTTASTFFTVTYISGNASTASTFQDAVISILNK